MKKIILLLCTIFVVNVVHSQNSQGILFRELSWEKALKEAKLQNKKIFVDCYTTWCGPCKKMSNTEFTKKEAGDFFNKSFICIKIDMEKGEGIALSKKFNVSSYPTFLFVDKEGKEQGRVSGAMDIHKFINQVKMVLDVENSPAFKLSRYRETPSVAYALDYMSALHNVNDMATIRSFIEKDLLSKPLDEVISFPVWPYFVENAKQSDTIQNYIREHRLYFNQIIGKQVTDRLFINISEEKLYYHLTGDKVLSDTEVRTQIDHLIDLMNSEDIVAAIFAEVARLSLKNDYKAIERLLDADYYVVAISNMDLLSIENLFMNMKGVSQQAKDNYNKRKKELLQEMSAN